MKKADNFDASKWLIENKITFQSRLNEEVKKGTYDLKKETDGIDYLYLYLGYDTPEGKNPNWTILTSQDGEIFSKRIKNDPFLPLLKNLPSAEQVDSDTLTVSLDDIKSIFSPIEKKKKEIVKINNNYVVKDEDEDFYYIDTDKALEYLSQFDNDDISAYGFINDDEGWGEFTSNIEDVEAMSDEELEDAMRQEMSYYFFSEPDGINESRLNEITEGKQVGDLYHFTLAGRIPFMLQDDMLKAFQSNVKTALSDKDVKRYISFTRNKNLFLNPSSIAGNFEAALVLDGDKLSSNYKIEPYNAPESKKNEYEERLVFKDPTGKGPDKIGITNLKKYVKKVIIIGDKFEEDELENIKNQIKKQIDTDIEVIYKKKYPLKTTKDIRDKQDALKNKMVKQQGRPKKK